MADLQHVIVDLTADAAEVDRLVADLEPQDWGTPTPAPGWSIAHQVGHLGFIFTIAGLAAAEPDAFRAMTANLGAPGAFDAAVNGALAEYVALEPAALLARWRAERDTGIAALAAARSDELVPWLVNPLPPAVLASAGLLELFGHGQDIADAMGVTRIRTDRIRFLVEFIARTRDFGFVGRGLTPPAEEFRFELTAPSGAQWEIGPADGEQRVTGSAEDLCLLATRRRHHHDLDIKAVGADAEQWLEIAQAYRGPAGEGREPGQFQAS